MILGAILFCAILVAFTARPVEGAPMSEPEITVCKYCGQPIAWGETEKIYDSKHPTGRAPLRAERWLALDPDLMPHGCPARPAPKRRK